MDMYATTARTHLAVVGMAGGERELELRVLVAQLRMASEQIAEPKVTSKNVGVGDEVEVMGAVCGGWPAKPSAVTQRLVVSRRVLASTRAAIGASIRDERHEVDHRLGRQARHGGRTDVVDSAPGRSGVSRSTSVANRAGQRSS